MSTSKVRLAIINHDKCKPTKCAHECIKKCPINAQGKKCIDIEDIGQSPSLSKKGAKIAESLCIGCGLCEKACPFKAITIVNLPTELTADIIHRYNDNGFRLYRLPSIQPNQVMGILGPNGIGKSTMVKILTGLVVPNFEQPTMSQKAQLAYFKKFGASVHGYFKALTSKPHTAGLKVALKRQDMQYYVDRDPDLKHLSGGEQQLRICTEVASQKADVYIFDEPTNYLDIKQRILTADLIRSLRADDVYVIVIDHDISFLDYCCDVTSIMYGVPGAYGVVSKPYTTAEAINNYLDGYLPLENIKFREPFSYSRNLDLLGGDADTGLAVGEVCTDTYYDYPTLTAEYKGFKLVTKAGKIPIHSSVTLVLGENGTGKTTFIKNIQQKLELTISVKSQYPKFRHIDAHYSVKMLLLQHASHAVTDQMFRSDVVKPLGVDSLMDKQVCNLSGGEQQRVAIVCCLAQDRDLYILDEPSAMLDIEQRVNFSKVMKRYIYHNRKAAIIIEHDISVALSVGKELDSNVIVFDKFIDDGVSRSTASEPMNMHAGMNEFLRILDVTFRCNDKYRRHRINKPGSIKDREQRSQGKYYIDA